MGGIPRDVSYAPPVGPRPTVPSLPKEAGPLIPTPQPSPLNIKWNLEPDIVCASENWQSSGNQVSTKPSEVFP